MMLHSLPTSILIISYFFSGLLLFLFVWFGLVFGFWFFEAGFLCVAQAGLELRNPPASAFQVLGLKECATTVPLDSWFFRVDLLVCLSL